ncbi:MAG: hypothetical protein KME18_21175 [Phormidium tanganyikae FI6-MK23]|nr:hypothetical protein [Phormidium tanganyikae FI6-MK23]
MIRDCFLLLLEIRRTQPRSLQHCIELCNQQKDPDHDTESCPDLEACLARYRRNQRTKQ